MYNTPRPGPQPPGPPHYAPPPEALLRPPRRYAGLRFVASTCVTSAWLTLALSIIGGVLMIAGGAASATSSAAGMLGPSASGAGASEGGGSAAGNALGALLPLMLHGLQIAGGVFTIATGAITFLVLLALGMLIYVLIDTEENTRTAAAAMTAIARRMGMGA